MNSTNLNRFLRVGIVDLLILTLYQIYYHTIHYKKKVRFYWWVCHPLLEESNSSFH